MNKNYIATLIATVFVAFNLSAQVPNNSFETWNNDTLYTINTWRTNGGDYRKVPGKSGSAIKLNNILSGTDIQYTDLYQSNSSGFGVGPAFPWTYVCDSLRITYQCNLGLDSASISAGLTKTGETVPPFLTEVYITGTQNTWKTISVPFKFNNVSDSVPDSAWVYISPHDVYKSTPGSLTIDKIEFVKNGSTLPSNIPNGDFENWNMNIQKFPAGWMTSDKFFTGSTGVPFAGSSIESSDAYSGSKAIKFTRGEKGVLKIPGAAISVNGNNPPNDEAPSFPVNQRYLSFRGYYKSSVFVGDRLNTFVNLFYQGKIVGTASFVDSTSKSGYTMFSENIDYDQTFSGIPDSATISIGVFDAFEEYPNNANSWVIVDELSLSIFGAATKNVTIQPMAVYPNPAAEKVHVKFKSTVSGITEWSISDLSGKNILDGNHSGAGVLSIGTSLLNNGCYLLKLTNNNTTYTQKILIQK